jgi:hypothetical protein
MPAAPRPLPPGLGRVFTAGAARAAGVSPSRLRAKDLERPFVGVRVVPVAPPIQDDGPLAIDRAESDRIEALIRAYAPLMPSGFFIAGRSALVWHGAAVPHGDELEVAVHLPERASRRAGVRGRAVAPHLVHVHDSRGVRVASPASAWAMLAGELDVRSLVRIGDQLVRIPRDELGMPEPGRQTATIEHLRAATFAGRRRGVADLREAVGLVRVGSMSPLETDARLVLGDAGLPEPELDVEIRSTEGRLLGISDAAYRLYRVALEIEGDHHRTSVRQWNRDLEKYAAYAAEGWEVVRLSAEHVRGRDRRAVDLVRAALVRRGADL